MTWGRFKIAKSLLGYSKDAVLFWQASSWKKSAVPVPGPCNKMSCFGN